MKNFGKIIAGFFLLALAISLPQKSHAELDQAYLNNKLNEECGSLNPSNSYACDMAISVCRIHYQNCAEDRCLQWCTSENVNWCQSVVRGGDSSVYSDVDAIQDACKEPPPPPLFQSVCGDNIVQGLESCEDGNITNGDGCDKDCHVEAGWSCDNSASPSKCSMVIVNEFSPVYNSPSTIIDYNDINKITYLPDSGNVPNANPTPINAAVDNVDVSKIDLPNGSDSSDPKPMVSMFGGGCSINTFEQVSPWTTYVMFLGLGLLLVAIRRSRRGSKPRVRKLVSTWLGG